jgi:four helix bundle protein
MAVRTSFENLQVYKLSEKLADEVWTVVTGWEPFAKTTVGRQMVRAADSVGANIAEGSGRRSFQDNRRFVRVARGSLNETKHWLRRAYHRGLLSTEDIKRIGPIIDELAPKLNAYLQSIGSIPETVRGDESGDRATDNGQRTTDSSC